MTYFVYVDDCCVLIHLSAKIGSKLLNWTVFWMHDKLHSQVKGLQPEEFAVRNDLVLALPDRIQAIPDGAPAAPKQTGGWAASASRTEIKFDSGIIHCLFMLLKCGRVC